MAKLGWIMKAATVTRNFMPRLLIHSVQRNFDKVKPWDSIENSASYQSMESLLCDPSTSLQ